MTRLVARSALQPLVWGSVLFLFGILATLLVGPWANDHASDVPLFAAYSRAMMHGYLPYRQFFFEYPPLAAPILAMAGITGTSYGAYRITLLCIVLVVGIGVLALSRTLARRTGGDERVAIAATAITPLLIGTALRTHFDVVPIALTLGALILILGKHPRLGFALLGIAVGVKAFPAIVAVVAVPWVWRRAGRRVALECLFSLVAVMVAAGTVGVLLSWHGMVQSLQFQFNRPVEIESTAASTLVALGHAGLPYPKVVFGARAWGLEGAGAGVITGLLDALGAVTLAAIAVRVTRRPGIHELVLGSLASIAVFMTFGKVLSPQYLVWIIPLFALAAAWGLWSLTVAAGSAMLLTLAEFPSHLGDLVKQSTFWQIEVGLRNLMLLAVVYLCYRALGVQRAEGQLRRQLTHVLPGRQAAGVSPSRALPAGISRASSTSGR